MKRYTFIFADGALFATQGQGLINEVKITVQKLGGLRGEGAYFRQNTVLGQCWSKIVFLVTCPYTIWEAACFGHNWHCACSVQLPRLIVFGYL